MWPGISFLVLSTKFHPDYGLLLKLYAFPLAAYLCALLSAYTNKNGHFWESAYEDTLATGGHLLKYSITYSSTVSCNVKLEVDRLRLTFLRNDQQLCSLCTMRNQQALVYQYLAERDWIYLHHQLWQALYSKHRKPRQWAANEAIVLLCVRV